MFLKRIGNARLRLHGSVPTKLLRVMKLLAFFILVACLQVSAKGFSQITLNESNTPLKKVFKKLQKQSGYDFLCTYQLLQQAGNVTVQLKNVSLRAAMAEILKGKGLDYTILEKTVVIKEKQAALPIQSLESIQAPIPVEIGGTVKDENGKPLEGVSVTVRGTKKGTSTKKDGSFTLDAKQGDVLIFSIVGYKNRSVTVGSSTNISVQMEVEAVAGSEVIVVGFATQKKTNVTGAVSQVGGEVLENRPIVSVAEGLQGVVPNLNISTTAAGGAPDAEMNINVRGFTGLGSSGSPLIVIDGVPSANMNQLSPNDIESISVLKDAASASIYGSRAPYGVILIVTKKGKKNKPLQVTYNNVLSLSSPINLPNMVDSWTYANFLNEAAANSGVALPYTQTVLDRIQNYKPGDSTTRANAANNQFLGGVNANDNINWFKVYFKDNSPFMQHNLNVRGGSDMFTYFLSGGYTDKQGLYNFSTDSYKRYNVLTNISADVKPWLTVNIKAAYTDGVSDAPNVPNGLTGGNNIHQIARIRPTEPLFNPDGNYSVGSNIPVFLNGGRRIADLKQTELNGGFVLKPLTGFEINGNYNFLFSDNDVSSHIKTVYAYDALGVAFVPANWGSPNSYARSILNRTYKNANLFGSYERRIKKHYFKLLAGLQTENNYLYTLSASNSNLYTDQLPSLNLTSGITTRALSDAGDEWSTIGIFSRLNYNFDEKYLLELNIRRDGSSRFPPFKKYGVFPSVSGGYILSRENFWNSIQPYVNTMKLRASYGSLGDQNGIGSYSFVNILPNSTTGSYIFGTNASPYVGGPGTLTSSDFTWANPTLLDFGTDITFFKNRLTVTADWYKRRINDLLGSRGNYPAVLGIQPPILNNASIETKGYEIEVSWKQRAKSSSSFSYGITASLADFTGKVVKYSGNPNGLLSDWIEGRPMGEIWGFETIGLIKDSLDFAKNGASQKGIYNRWRPGDVMYKDLNGNDSIEIGNNTLANPGDQKVIGNSTPRYQYGITLDAAWNGFDISVFAQGVAERDVFLNSNMFWGFEPAGGNQFQSTVFKENLDRWTPSTPDGYFPRYYYQSAEMAKNTRVQTRYLQNAGYLRIKNLRLGYAVPPSVLKRIKMQRLYIYASVQNLATFTKLTKTFDPEVAIGTPQGGNGDAKVYPLQRTLSVGVNLSF